MNNRTNVNAMAEKYKAEMMRIYNQSGGGTTPRNKAVPEKHEKEIIEDSRPPVMPPVSNFTEDSPPPSEAVETKPSQPSKFPSPDEILAAEKKAVPVISSAYEISAMPEIAGKSDRTAETSNIMQGNYGNAESDDLIEEDSLEPLYNGSWKEQPLADMKGSGYIKAEITTAGGAVPIQGANVIITRREGDKTLLIRMLTTDSSGGTDIVSLPAPDIVYSENPDPEEKPFTEYILSIYADGFYAVPEIIVPVFTTVKSIQPISLVPLAQFEMQGSTSPAAAENRG